MRDGVRVGKRYVATARCVDIRNRDLRALSTAGGISQSFELGVAKHASKKPEDESEHPLVL